MTDAERLAAVHVYLSPFPTEADADTVRRAANARWKQPPESVIDCAFWLLSKYMESKAKARYRSLEHFVGVAHAERRRGRLG